MDNFHKIKMFWSSKIDLFETSNMTKADFCRQNNLSVKTFSHWHKKIIIKKGQASKSFVELKVNDLPIVTSRQSYYDLIISDFIKIRVSKYFDSELLVRIIKTLEAM
jgi:hypothetical protein